MPFRSFPASCWRLLITSWMLILRIVSARAITWRSYRQSLTPPPPLPMVVVRKARPNVPKNRTKQMFATVRGLI
uniref:Putative secreted protein n=1 Tax=Anopheles darlingi TaxID=43151 RepID=A0A2M4DDV2_ANODA